MKKAPMIGIIVIAIVGIVIFAVFVNKDSGEQKYNEAMALLDEGKKDEAYEILTQIKKYKDSLFLATEIFTETRLEELSAAAVGDQIIFGEYEQDNDIENGSEPIEWLVLDKTEDGKTNRILLLSAYALDCVVFDDKLTTDDVTWQDSSIRRWLNRSFLLTAFDAVEEQFIESVLLTDDKGNPYDKEDKVFLLSYTEAEKYLYQNPEKRYCAATEYTKAMGAYTSKEDPDQEQDMCFWWLRTIGHNFRTASCVSDTGYLSYTGYAVNDDSRAVRPALWLDVGRSNN